MRCDLSFAAVADSADVNEELICTTIYIKV
jgi:hypothetical protein